MSNYSIKIAAFTCNTSGARQNIVPSGGPGTNPKAAIFVVSGATALDTSSSPSRVSIGMTDGTTQLCNALMSEDNNVLTVSSADTGNRFDNAQVITTCLTTSEAIDSAANFVAWTNDGVAINWSDFPATALRGHVIFFYGSDLSADVVSFTPSTTQDSGVTQTGLSFQPDALIGVSSWNTYSAGGSGATARISIGFASNYGGSIQQTSRTHTDADRLVGTSAIHRSNRFLSRISTTAETASYEVTAFTSDGFTITTRGGSLGSPCAILALKVNGARIRAHSELVNTNAAGQKYIEAFGFKPKSALFLGGESTTSNTISTTQTGGAFFGAAVSTTEEFSTAWVDENHGLGTDVNDTYSMTTSSAPIRIPNVSGGTLLVAPLTSFTHNGINFEVTTASVNDHLMSFLAFEDDDARQPDETERISDQGILLVTSDRRVATDAEQISDQGILLVTIDRLRSSDTENISDQFVSVLTGGDLKEDFADTESIIDEFVIRTTDRKTFADTEEITDAFRLVVTSDFRVSNDTEQIAEAVLLVRTSDRRISDDTEQIADAFTTILNNFRTATDTVEIGDGFVLVSTGTTVFISNDTEQISDAFVTVLAEAGDLFFVADETVQLADGYVMVTGQVLVSGDTEALTDAFNTGRGLIARKAIKRGRVF